MSPQSQTLLRKRVSSPPTPTKPLWRLYLELTRLHKFPLGSILVFWPSAWGLTMAAYSVGLPARSLAVQTLMFAIGSTLLHSAACVLNDICDVDFDRQVERTKNRPLAAGLISTLHASILLFVLVCASLSMLLLTNSTAAMYGIIGVFPLHALYPLMKRWTWWPQAWLGLAMNWGFPVAWISVTGKMDTMIVTIFFLGTVCWTIVYDTIYGCQDRKDDMTAGVKSTSILFGDSIRQILIAFAAMFLACMACAGLLNHQGTPFFIVSVGGAGLYFTWQFLVWNVNDPQDCGAKFQGNGNLGYIVWCGMLIDYYLKTRSVN